MEFGNKSMLAGLGLTLPRDKVDLVRTTDKQAREMAGSGVSQLLDPGVMPILEEGATPWNLGMLGVGLMTGGQGGKVVNFGTRLAKKNLSRLNKLTDELFRGSDEFREYNKVNKGIGDFLGILEMDGKERVAFRAGLTPKELDTMTEQAHRNRKTLDKEIGKWRMERLEKIKELPPDDAKTLLTEVQRKIDDTKYTWELLPKDQHGRIVDHEMVAELTDDLDFYEQLLMDVELYVGPRGLPPKKAGNVTPFKPKDTK